MAKTNYKLNFDHATLTSAISSTDIQSTVRSASVELSLGFTSRNHQGKEAHDLDFCPSICYYVI